MHMDMFLHLSGRKCMLFMCDGGVRGAGCGLITLASTTRIKQLTRRNQMVLQAFAFLHKYARISPNQQVTGGQVDRWTAGINAFSMLLLSAPAAPGV